MDPLYNLFLSRFDLFQSFTGEIKTEYNSLVTGGLCSGSAVSIVLMDAGIQGNIR